jgi:hypothetical protein
VIRAALTRSFGRQAFSPRRILFVAALVASILIALVLTVSPANALPFVPSACQATTFIRDGMPLTTKVRNTSLLNQDVEAIDDFTGLPCHMGAFYDVPASYSIVNSSVHGSTYFGIVANGGGVTLDVTDSSAFEVGDKPTHTGTQHGVAIAYLDGATGSVSRTQVYGYQKNGFAANGTGTVVTIADSRFRGAGPVDYIAQNGVQFSRGAIGGITGSTMEEHEYTGCSQQQSQQTDCTPFVSAGLLIFDSPAKSIDRKNNLYRENDFNVLNVQIPGP